jgi:hypothetical protein
MQFVEWTKVNSDGDGEVCDATGNHQGETAGHLIKNFLIPLRQYLKWPVTQVLNSELTWRHAPTILLARIILKLMNC